MDERPSLERTLQLLHASGISAGIESCPQDGMQVWIGDDVRKIEATKIEPATTAAGQRWLDTSAAARWLAQAAARLFPDTRFGLEHRSRHGR